MVGPGIVVQGVVTPTPIRQLDYHWYPETSSPTRRESLRHCLMIPWPRHTTLAMAAIHMLITTLNGLRRKSKKKYHHAMRFLFIYLFLIIIYCFLFILSITSYYFSVLLITKSSFSFSHGKSLFFLLLVFFSFIFNFVFVSFLFIKATLSSFFFSLTDDLQPSSHTFFY